MPESDPTPEDAVPSAPTTAATAVLEPSAPATAVLEPSAPATGQPAAEPISRSDAAVPPPVGPESAAPSGEPKPRRAVGPLVAAAAIGAIVGGASGAGIAAWTLADSEGASQTTAAPQTITVNDPGAVNTINAVAAKAGPSVVTISVSSQNSAGTGSGVILSADGTVLTNNHVVTLDGSTSDATIEVTTADGRIYRAEIVGTDPIVDLAVIRLVDADGLTPIEFGDVDALDVGDAAVAIGAPLSLANTVTDGIVSTLNRSIQVASSAVPDDGTDSNGGQGPFNFDFPGQRPATGTGTISIPVIQTDAAINPGNSGGALVNDSGELIGIVVAIASAGGPNSSAGSIGVGFAIPADLALRVADEIIQGGVATHGLLGATVRNATGADGSVVGGYLVEISDGGAAAAAGLQPGDVVTSLAGIPIAGSVDLTAQVRSHAAGEDVEVTYVRDGAEKSVTVTLGRYES